MPARETRAVTLYTRHDCHLCDDAAAMLRELAPVLHFTIVTVDVDTDPALAARYNDAVPVIAIDGRTVAAAPVDIDALQEALAAALRALPANDA